MITSIASSLGIGSGINTKTLVAELAANAREAREFTIVAKERSNGARISAVASLKDGLASLLSDYKDSASGVDLAGMKKLANAFVSGFNVLQGSLADAMRGGSVLVSAGALTGDSAARAVQAEFRRLPQSELVATGTYKSLSDIGIGISRTGSLTIDTAKFDAAVAAAPAEVSALLISPTGLSATLGAMKDRLTLGNGALSIAASRYERIGTAIAKERIRMEDDNARLIDRLTKSFGGMDRRVAQLKAVQSYVEQQVAAWNAQR
jgi:flagellar hook-associated protein 2